MKIDYYSKELQLVQNEVEELSYYLQSIQTA